MSQLTAKIRPSKAKTSYEKSSEKQKKAEKIFEVKKRVKESQKKAVRERTAKKKRGKVMLWAYK